MPSSSPSLTSPSASSSPEATGGPVPPRVRCSTARRRYRCRPPGYGGSLRPASAAAFYGGTGELVPWGVAAGPGSASSAGSTRAVERLRRACASSEAERALAQPATLAMVGEQRRAHPQLPGRTSPGLLALFVFVAVLVEVDGNSEAVRKRHEFGLETEAKERVLTAPAGPVGSRRRRDDLPILGARFGVAHDLKHAGGVALGEELGDGCLEWEESTEQSGEVFVQRVRLRLAGSNAPAVPARHRSPGLADALGRSA